MTGDSVCFPEGEAGGVDEYDVENSLVSSSKSVTVCLSLSVRVDEVGEGG